MNAILVDDELMALEELEYFLKKEDGINIIGMFHDSLEALEKISKNKPDIVFLDIDMPELDGISLANEILKFNEHIYIVFVTAFHDYAVKAFEIDALDYIEKPFDENRIHKVILKLSKRNVYPNSSEEKSKKESIENCVINLNKNIKKIPVWKNDRILLLDIKDIVFFTIESKEMMVFCNNGEFYYTKETLNHWEIRLKDKGFFRSHKSFLVNIDKIIEIIPWFNNTYNLNVEKYQQSIPVSRNYIKSFKSIFEL